MSIPLEPLVSRAAKLGESAVLLRGTDDEDEEICILDCTVEWRAIRSKTVRKRFRFPTPPLQVVTLGSGLDTSVAVLKRLDMIEIFAPNGDAVEVPLPFQAERLWSLGSILLVQRSFEDGGSATAMSNSGPSVEDDAFPTLFSLSHRLNELKPVALQVPRAVAGTEEPRTYMADARESIIFSSESAAAAEINLDESSRIAPTKPQSSLGIVVTYHRDTCEYTAWVARRVRASLAFTVVQREEPKGGMHTPRSSSPMMMTFQESYTDTKTTVVTESVITTPGSPEMSVRFGDNLPMPPNTTRQARQSLARGHGLATPQVARHRSRRAALADTLELESNLTAGLGLAGDASASMLNPPSTTAADEPSLLAPEIELHALCVSVGTSIEDALSGIQLQWSRRNTDASGFWHDNGGPPPPPPSTPPSRSPARMDLAGEPTYSWSPSAGGGLPVLEDDIFYSLTEHGDPILCILSKQLQTLFGYTLSVLQIFEDSLPMLSEVFRIPALLACPIAALDPVHSVKAQRGHTEPTWALMGNVAYGEEIIVQDPATKRLKLYRGDVKVGTVSCRMIADFDVHEVLRDWSSEWRAESAVRREGSAERACEYLVDLSHGKENRVTLTFGRPGSATRKSVRAFIRLGPTGDESVAALCTAVDCAFGLKQAVGFRTDAQNTARAIRDTQGMPLCIPEDEVQLAGAVAVLLGAILGMSHVNEVLQKDVDSSVSADAVAALAHSSFHEEVFAGDSYLMELLECQQPQDFHQTPDTSSLLLRALNEVRSEYSLSEDGFLADGGRTAFIGNYRNFLCALHILTEDNKLVGVRTQVANLLGTLTLALAQVGHVPNLVEHHERYLTRDAGGSVSRGLHVCPTPSTESSLHPLIMRTLGRVGVVDDISEACTVLGLCYVPDIFAWVGKCYLAASDAGADLGSQSADTTSWYDLQQQGEVDCVATSALLPEAEGSVIDSLNRKMFPTLAASPFRAGHDPTPLLTFYNSLMTLIMDAILALKTRSEGVEATHVPEQALLYASEAGIHPEILESLRLGVALPLLELLAICKRVLASPSPQLNAEILLLAGRGDLNHWKTTFEKTTLKAPREVSEHFRESLESVVSSFNVKTTAAPFLDGGAGASLAGLPENKLEQNTDADGLISIEVQSRMRFGRDRRMHTVCQYLRSSLPLTFMCEKAPEMSDLDYEERKQAALLDGVKRSLASILGRGALSVYQLQYQEDVSSAVERLEVPLICVQGILNPGNVSVILDVNSKPRDWASWARFHNGVAASLRLPGAPETHAVPAERHRYTATVDEPEDDLEEAPSYASRAGTVTRQWIVYNKAKMAADAHAGFLFGLSLNGHLECLARHDIYEYLTSGHELTAAALLLGLASAKRGTADLRISKMLLLHVPSLLPSQLYALEVPPVAQVSAIAGLGLLYQGTANRLMAEFLLAEIARKPISDATKCRDSYALASGFALGNVVLGKGRKPQDAGLHDLDLERRLVALIKGGKLGIHRPTKQSRPWYEYAQGIVDSNPNTAGSGNIGVATADRTSRFLEGDCVNTAVTAPAATVALGLLHLRSGSPYVAAALAAPQTLSELVESRPDLLGLRSVARALVLWDDVLPSAQWVTSQVPKELEDIYQDLPRQKRILLGREEKRESDDWPPKGPFNSRNANPDRSTAAPWVRARHGPDLDVIRAARTSIVGGACLGLALRFAGSHHIGARNAILHHVHVLLELGPRSGQKPDKVCLETALICCWLGATLVMAGSGCLECLRLFRRMRGEAGHASFGYDMALHLGLGLLFLGAGDVTLKNDDASVAAIFAAIYPRFPCDVGDVQHHLQSLRWLWVLATDQRSLYALEMGATLQDTRPVFLPVDIVLREGTEAAAAALSAMLNAELQILKSQSKSNRILRLEYSDVSSSEAALREALRSDYGLEDVEFLLVDRSRSGVAYCRCSAWMEGDLPSPKRLKTLICSTVEYTGFIETAMSDAYCCTKKRDGRSRKSLLPNAVVLRLTLPCLLPPIESIVEIRSASPRYYPMRCGHLNDGLKAVLKAGYVVIKRKAGYLPYLSDSAAHGSIHSRPLTNRSLGLLVDVTEPAANVRRGVSGFPTALVDNPLMQSFAKVFIESDAVELETHPQPKSLLAQALLSDALSFDRPEMLLPLMSIVDDVSKLSADVQPDAISAASWRLIRLYHEHLRDVLVAAALASHRQPRGATTVGGNTVSENDTASITTCTTVKDLLDGTLATNVSILTALDDDNLPLCANNSTLHMEQSEVLRHEDILRSAPIPGKAPTPANVLDSAPVLWDAPVPQIMDFDDMVGCFSAFQDHPRGNENTTPTAALAFSKRVKRACGDLCPMVPEPLESRLSADATAVLESDEMMQSLRRYYGFSPENSTGSPVDSLRSCALVYHALPTRGRLMQALEVQGSGADRRVLSVEEVEELAELLPEADATGLYTLLCVYSDR